MQIHVVRSSLAVAWRMVWKCTKLCRERQFGAFKIREDSDCGKEERAKLTVESTTMGGWLDLESCRKKEEGPEK